MEIIYSKRAQQDIAWWKNSGNKALMRKISTLVADIEQHPFSGTGKPEPLKYDFAGCWSRRIDAEHRIIYSVNEEQGEIYILSMRYHYR